MSLKRTLNLVKVAWSANKVRKSKSETEQILARQALVKMLADTRGVSMKVGQLFASIEGDSDFQVLVDGVEPLPLETMLPVLEQGLGQPIQAVFKSVDKAIGAASLGQVHFAVLNNGDEVAIKLRYPDIANAIDAELKLAGLLPEAGPIKKWDFDLESYKQTLKQNMQRELDYLSEAERQIHFKKVVKVEGLNTPYVYREYCSTSVLVQSRASGVLINEVVHWSEVDRLRIGEILLTTLFKSLFLAGEVHGDPHAGNSFYDHDELGQPRVSLLDYGCTLHVSKTRRFALFQLIVACRLKLDVSPLDYWVAMEFDAEKLSLLDALLPVICQHLFDPFLLDEVFNLDEWHLDSKMADLLADQRWLFRSASSADLLLLMRAFQGVVGQLKYLNVSFNWWQILQNAVGTELIQQAINQELPIEIVKQAGDKVSFLDPTI